MKEASLDMVSNVWMQQKKGAATGETIKGGREDALRWCSPE